MITGKLVDYRLKQYSETIDKKRNEIYKLNSIISDLKKENKRLNKELDYINLVRPVNYSTEESFKIYKNAFDDVLSENKMLKQENLKLKVDIVENIEKYDKLKIKHKKAANHIATLKNEDNHSTIENKYYRIKKIIGEL